MRPATLALAVLALAACRAEPATHPPGPPTGIVADTIAPAPATAADEAASADAPTSPAKKGPLDDVSIPPRPDWTDKYAAENKGDPRFFDMSALQRQHGLDRARAVELQNHYRDLTRAEPEGDRAKQFAEALDRAKRGLFEDRRDLDKLRTARFIVVFDLDETLYDQFYAPDVAKDCSDLDVDYGGGQRRKIKLAPGAALALDRVAALGGAVVVFSAAPDEPVLANLRAWSFGGRPLVEHPAIAGVLTNSHLVLQSKHEGSGSEDPKRGRPVVEPSKDLRIVDEALTKAILVDDNPLRAFQFRNLRIVKKFDADLYCTTKDAKVKKAFERVLPEVVAEIEDSVRWMKASSSDFATAYLPYSQLGALAVGFLRKAGMSERAAIEHVRRHPDLVDRDF
jgi:hypothetical protein